MRVKEEGAGVRRRELINETLTRIDGLLRDEGHTIHGIGHADAVPVYGGVLAQAIAEPDAQGLATRHAYQRQHAVDIAPERCRIFAAEERAREFLRGDVEGSNTRLDCRR